MDSAAFAFARYHPDRLARAAGRCRSSALAKVTDPLADGAIAAAVRLLSVRRSISFAKSIFPWRPRGDLIEGPAHRALEGELPRIPSVSEFSAGPIWNSTEISIHSRSTRLLAFRRMLQSGSF